nr:AsmA-like C-terminal region-containing protein [Aurantimonas sp. HBX-1]
MVRVFVFFGGLLVLALVAALVAPFFIDWTAYRAHFEREASSILGRDVVVRGAASARLLPFPSVTFEDVEVMGEGGAPLLTVDRFRMDAELAPYLSGEIFIYAMTLDRPQLRLPIRPDGGVDLVVVKPAIPNGATVVLDNVSVNDGTVVIEQGSTGRRHELSDLNATLSADSLAGPVAGRGTFETGGETVAFSVSTGTLQADGGLPLHVEVANASLAAQLLLDGAATMQAGLPHFAGTARLVRPWQPPQAPVEGSVDPFRPAETSQAEAAAVAALPLRATGAIELSPRVAEFTDIRLEAGASEQPYLLTGKGRLNFAGVPRFSLSLEGEQVDVDQVAGGADPAAPDAAPLDLAQRVEAMRQVLAEIPRPGMAGTVEITLPVVVAGDTTIRDVAFAASPTGNGWALPRFTAELPGRTRLEADGIVGLDEAFSFRGNLLLASQQPSGFSDWLSGAVDPAIRTLGRAGLSASAELTSERQVFEDLEIDIGGDQLAGRLERTKDGETTTIVADLAGKAVDLDALQALSRLLTGSADSLATADRFDVSLRAGPVSYAGTAADRIEADVVYDGETLAIDTLEVTGLAGASLTAAGRLTDLSGAAAGELAVSLESDAPDRFIALLQTRFPGVPLLEALGHRADRLAPLRLAGEVRTIEADGAGRPTLHVRLDGTADGTKIDLTSAVENGLYARRESGRFGLDLRLENDRPAVLLEQLGIEAIDVGAPAPLEAELSLSAAATGPVVTTATLRAPGSEASFDGVVEVTPSGVEGVEASVYLDSEDASPWMLTTGIDLAQGLAAIPVDVSGSVVYGEGDWALNAISGAIGDTDVGADLVKAAGEAFTGTVRVGSLSLPWLAELVYGRAIDEGGAGTGWPDAAFGPPRLPEIPFEVSLQSDFLDLGGPLLKDFSATVSGSGDRLAFEAARGAGLGGNLSGRLELRNAAGIGGLSLEARSDDLEIGALWPALVAGEGAGRLGGEVRIEGAGQSYAAMVAGLTGAGRVTVRDIVLPGIPETVLPPLLAAADAEGFAPEADTAEALAALSADQRFGVEELATEFSVAAGTVRFAPVTLRRDDATLTLAGSVDLAAMTAAGDFSLLIDPGDDRVAGAEPAVAYTLEGPLAAPTLSRDVAALTNYLSVRALEREQARVEAMQESLQERLRLRREARFYRWQEAEAARITEERRLVAEEAERRRAEAAAEAERRAAEAAAAERREAEAAAAAEAERQRAAAAEAARQREAESAAAARRERQAAEERPRQAPEPAPRPPAAASQGQPLDFDRPLPGTPPPAVDDNFLPGVQDPLRF